MRLSAPEVLRVAAGGVVVEQEVAWVDAEHEESVKASRVVGFDGAYRPNWARAKGGVAEGHEADDVDEVALGVLNHLVAA